MGYGAYGVWCIYLHWMARIDGKLVGKYTSPIEHLGSGKQKGSWLFKLYIYTQEVQRPKFAHCSRESFIWIILKTILCLVLDFQGI